MGKVREGKDGVASWLTVRPIGRRSRHDARQEPDVLATERACKRCAPLSFLALRLACGGGADLEEAAPMIITLAPRWPLHHPRQASGLAQSQRKLVISSSGSALQVPVLRSALVLQTVPRPARRFADSSLVIACVRLEVPPEVQGLGTAGGCSVADPIGGRSGFD